MVTFSTHRNGALQTGKGIYIGANLGMESDNQNKAGKYMFLV
jgi:hypothetical protein